MTNITLSIDDSIYRKMKKYSEIKWSEYVRKIIEKRINDLEKIQALSHEEDIEFLADEGLLAEDWLSSEDMEAWKNL
jgi:predicted CopG family antitoxin